MADRAPVRCPACGREHSYTAPTFPCACGTPLAPPVRRGGLPVQVPHRSWDDSWVRVRCPDCGRCDQWPQPEFDCPCGVLVRLPVDGAQAGGEGGQPAAQRDPAPPPGELPAAPVTLPPPAGEVPASAGGAPPAAVRAPFRPVTIRTGQDALLAATEYLKWLGFTGVRPAGGRTGGGIDLRGDRLVAQVDPTTQPTGPREVECLWLSRLHEDAVGAFFALAGYTADARSGADRLGVPLFALDLTGTPQPVNDAARALVRSGPGPDG